MRCIPYLLTALTALSLSLSAWNAHAALTTKVGEVQLELSGSANIRGDANRVRKRDRETTNNSGNIYNVLVINGKATAGQQSVITQIRPFMTFKFDPASGHYSEISVDELYWDGKLTDAISATAGRRRIVNGVALGYNPTDFLSHDKIVTGSNLTDVERRSERKGDNLVGVSKYFDNATLSAYLLFPNSVSMDDNLRGLAQFSHRIQPLQTDYTLLAYYDDHLKVGVNVATTISFNVTGYIEAAFSQERDRRTVKLPKHPPLQLGSYKDILETEKTGSAAELKYYDAVVGLQYTAESGVGLNVEYWRSNTGYSQNEFDDIFESIEMGMLPPKTAVDMFTDNNNIRREKIFARISDIPLTDDLKLEQTGIVGLNDKSYFSRTSLIWQTSDASEMRLNLNFLGGEKRTEFGMSPTEWQIFSSYKHYF